MVHAPGTQTRLRHGKTGTPGTQQLVVWHPHIAQHDFAVALRSMVVHHRDIAHHLHAGRVQRHQNHAVLVVRARIGVALFLRIATHHDQQFAMRVGHAGDKPFAPIEHQLPARAAHGGLQIGRVARRHIGFRHGEG